MRAGASRLVGLLDPYGAVPVQRTHVHSVAQGVRDLDGFGGKSWLARFLAEVLDEEFFVEIHPRMLRIGS